jgi:hypothetical protein
MTRLLLLFLLLSQVSFGQSKTRKSFLIDTSINLFAFVGEKVSLTEYDPNASYSNPTSILVDTATGDTILQRRSYIIMDNAFEGKYRVLQPVFNDLKTDTIVFKAFDHYGRPAFESYSPVLLYLSKSEDGSYYFHQKYQFDPLKRRKDGSWVGKDGKSLQTLFKIKKKTVFKARGVFKS